MDEVSIGRGGASAAAFLDVQRVAVLRGQQGTPYGRNASAGVIAFYANRPRERFEGSLVASYGNFGTYVAKAVVTASLTADVALRVAGPYSHKIGSTQVRNQG